LWVQVKLVKSYAKVLPRFGIVPDNDVYYYR